MRNPEKTYTAISAAVALFAGLWIFLPEWLGIDGMRGGFAISFVALFVCISAAVLIFFFRGRAAQVERILSGKDLLAHWTYAPDEWLRYVEAELKEQTQENRALWLLISAFCVVIGGLFWLFDREAGGFVLAVLLGLSLLLLVVAYGVPRLRRRRQRRAPGEAWITRRAIFFDGSLLAWNSWGARLESAALREASAEAPACLKLEVSYPSRSGRQTQTLRIPIPAGRAAEAQAVVEQL